MQASPTTLDPTTLALSREDEVLEAIRIAFDMSAMASSAMTEAVEAARHAGQMLLELKDEKLSASKVSINEWLRIRVGDDAAKVVKKWTELPKNTLNARQEVLALGVVPDKPAREGEGVGGGIQIGQPYLRHVNALCEYLRELKQSGRSMSHAQRTDFRELINLLAGL